MAMYSPTMNVMMRAVEKASRSLIRDFGEVEQLQVSRKGPGDFVSAADHRSEEILHYELKKARPSYGFLMEEQGEIKGEDGENRWIIDPLDGTSNFLHGIPHWCVTVALETKGEIAIGLTYDPVRDEMFTVEKGNPAMMNRKRLRVSGRSQMSDSILSCGIPGINHEGNMNIYVNQLETLIPEVTAIRRMGAGALDLAYVAAGRFEGFWEYNLKPWDIAAGMLMIKESGGFITTIHGRDNPLYKDNLIAANDGVYNELKKILEQSENEKNAA